MACERRPINRVHGPGSSRSFRQKVCGMVVRNRVRNRQRRGRRDHWMILARVTELDAENNGGQKKNAERRSTSYRPARRTIPFPPRSFVIHEPTITPFNPVMAANRAAELAVSCAVRGGTS